MIPEREPEKWLPHPREAAGAQITQSEYPEVVTRNNNTGSKGFRNWNENNVTTLSSNNWRASLVPAAAVIPAPIAYAKVAAVKKLVVESQGGNAGPPMVRTVLLFFLLNDNSVLHWVGLDFRSFTLKKLECSKQAQALNTLAWNNRIGLWFYFVGFWN